MEDIVMRSLFILAFAFAAACGSSSTHTEALIDSRGGSLQIEQGTGSGASITIPAGAVDAPTQFTVTARNGVDGLPSGMHATGAVLTFGPEGTRFALPVHITVPTSRAPMTLLTRPGAGQPWTRVEGAVWDIERNMIVADVNHFSDFVPVEGDMVSDGGTPVETDAGDFCITHPRDPSCVHVDPPLPGCDPIAQDCPSGQMCIATDQESGYDWGDGRPAYCITAGAGAVGSACTAASDCMVGTQCVFQTMYDDTMRWFSQEQAYLPMYDSICLPVCTLGGSDCPTDLVCHPIQLWGFSGRDVNEVYGACAPPSPPIGPRT
jgi:hypothetical protein